MRQNVFTDIQQLFRNKALNILGVERSIHELLADNDVDKAIQMMQDRDEEVDNTLREYNPQHHKVKRRPNKERDIDEPYITEKLPRNLQSYINEIELFFLLGQDIIWSKKKGSDEAFNAFKDFLNATHFNSLIRKAKRLAGAETESAIVYHLYNENGKVQVVPFVAARSTGYTLRPLFDQYGRLKALAIGYTLKESNGTIRHWDIMTAEAIYYCKRSTVSWEVDTYRNPIGKIPAVYFQQQKAWYGADERLDRIEELDSKAADTNNYFADPIAEATADVIQSMATPDKPGRLIQLTSEKSRFGYVTPPNGSQPRTEEQKNLKESVFFDTMTPDFDVEKMRGLGTLSGAALKNSFAIGYIKRDNRKEDYDRYIDYLTSVDIAIVQLQHPELHCDLEELKVGHEFADPFASDKEERWARIEALYTTGVASLETVVQMLALTDAPQDEINRIRAMEMDKIFTANEAKGANGKTPEEEAEEPNNNEPQ